MSDRPPLHLCAGTQSSGSTLVSWCFLQRPDMDGILDARGDLLPQIPAALSPQRIWCKTTISCFRFSEMIRHFQDEGWDVRPMLIVRDVRAVFNSLIRKSYGRNGTTAEEPPLRLRLRRFLDDWELARGRGWPMLRYESFVAEPREALQRVCGEMGLAWEEAMLTWPKGRQDMAAPVHGNPTFRMTCGSSLQDTLSPQLAEIRTEHIPPEDLAWMQREFAAFNEAMGYPAQVLPQAGADVPPRAIARFENTRRYQKRQKKWRLLRLFGSRK